jgi:hypothetical protein
VNILSKYKDVRELKEETGSQSYRYKISNGIRLANVKLKVHIPSYMSIGGHKVLISYDDQPTTCYGCSKTGHLFHDCPARNNRQSSQKSPKITTWTEIMRRGKEPSSDDNDHKSITLQDKGCGGTKEGTCNDMEKVNQTKPREKDEQQVTPQTLIREEIQ